MLKPLGNLHELRLSLKLDKSRRCFTAVAPARGHSALCHCLAQCGWESSFAQRLLALSRSPGVSELRELKPPRLLGQEGPSKDPASWHGPAGGTGSEAISNPELTSQTC